MPTPTFPVTGASTLQRDWIFEVNTGSVASPTWTMIGATTNTQFVPSAANWEDDSDMQSGGAGSQTKTADSASATLTVARKVADDGVSYDDGQEFVRAKSLLYGADNTVQLRISEYNPNGGPRVEAYMGFFGVAYEPQAGGNTALKTAQISFMGQGRCAEISHPYPVAGAVPVIGATSPPTSAAAGGVLVYIVGSGFTGTTGVTIGGNAASFGVESDTRIAISTPAHAAGAVTVVVTNATGASTTGAGKHTYS